MSIKTSLALLMLIITPLFSGFRDPITKNDVEPGATNILFQSMDGGLTWQDISSGLPENAQPEDLFAGDSEIYLRVNDVMYHSKSTLTTPVWEKENVLDPRSTSIAFNRSGVTAFNFEGQFYQRNNSGTWSPIYTSFKNQSVETVFETSDGIVFLGCGNGLYKSADKGQSWKQVRNAGGVMQMAESAGVLIATGQQGIMRSTDSGEHWEWVIREGGVGIAVEHIEGGFAVIAYNTTMQSRRIHISLDNGKTWNAVDEGLRRSSSISSVKQIGNYLLCGHPDGIFRSSDLGKTWSIVHSDNSAIKIGKPLNEGKVFKLYVSGDVLYAVAANAGC